ncbi:MAG: HEAT repeat domain-containing protein [Planctomycetes bacterium]|nr:HEAT repeat domain-containing protein [Planctomycetota bacterium]
MKKTFFIPVAGMIVISFFLGLTLWAGNPASDLQDGIKKPDRELVKKAVEQLVLQNDTKACDTLISSANSTEDSGIYWILLEGLSRFTNTEVISKLTGYILANKSKSIGRDLLGAMKNNRSSSILPLLKEVIEKGTYEMRIECIHQLSAITTREALEVLCGFLKTLDEKNDKELVKEAIASLKRITGVDRGNYPASWLQWWEENKNKQLGDIIKPKTAAGGSIDNVSVYRDMTGVEDLPKDKVIVIRNDLCDEKAKVSGFDGNYDHIQDILTRLGIAHTVVGKSELEKDSFDWDNAWVILFNCMLYKEHCCNPKHRAGKTKTSERLVNCEGEGAHQNHKPEVSDKVIKKIQKFVETGGYLFTEDMNINEIIVRAFKGIIASPRFLPAKDVPILPAPGAALHPYLKYVFEAAPSGSSDAPETSEAEKSGETRSVKPGEFRIDAEWKIDEDSPDIKVLKKDVTVLIMSPKLVTKSNTDGAVAVTFGVSGSNIVTTGTEKGPSYQGGGRVLHVMSHFGHQKSKVDEFALQNLILNFIMELNQRRPKGKK